MEKNKAHENMLVERMAELEKANTELKRKVDDQHFNDEISWYQQILKNLEEENIFLKERLTSNAVIIHIGMQTNCFEPEKEKVGYYVDDKYPHYIHVPLDVIRVKGMPMGFKKEFSPQALNQMVGQIEADLRERLIISVGME